MKKQSKKKEKGWQASLRAASDILKLLQLTEWLIELMKELF